MCRGCTSGVAFADGRGIYTFTITYIYVIVRTRARMCDHACARAEEAFTQPYNDWSFSVMESRMRVLFMSGLSMGDLAWADRHA